MNISGDGCNDGKFKIQGGQGLSQAIAGELGLSSEDCNRLKSASVWTEIMAKAKEQNDENNANRLSAIYEGGDELNGDIKSNFIVHKDQEISFSQKIWNDIIAIVNRALGKEIKATDSGVANADLNPTGSEEGSTDLNEVLVDSDFKTVLNTTIPDERYRETVLQYLDPANGKLDFKDEPNDPGMAQYIKTEGNIKVNTSSVRTINGIQRQTWGDLPTCEQLKILVHESMHAAQSTNFDTQEEELLCEMTAIKTGAALVAAGKIADGTSSYGKKYSELGKMTDDELREYLIENFIGDKTGHFKMGNVGPYSNRIIDNTGAVTIHDATGKQIPLSAGSKITVGGKEYTLGEDVYIEGIGGFAGTTCQVFKIGEGGRAQTIGIISFDELTALPMEQNIPPIQQHNSAISSNQFHSGSVQSGDKNYTFKMTGFNPNF